jgi:hypothetical protein
LVALEADIDIDKEIDKETDKIVVDKDTILI